MSTTLKVLLGILIGGLFVCMAIGAVTALGLRSAGQSLVEVFKNDAKAVRSVAGAIADYEIPAGFDGGSAARIADISFVSYTSADGHSHIMFVQVTADIHVDQSEIERQVSQVTGKPARGGRETKVVDQVPVVICGQEVTALISEGVNSDGQPFRVATAAFDGRGGQALVSFETPVAAWDQAVVDAFFASIRK
jgi:hypothetical protein